MTGLRSRCGGDAASSAVVGEDFAGARVGVSIPKNRPFARFFGIETAKSRCIRLVRAASLHPPQKKGVPPGWKKAAEQRPKDCVRGKKQTKFGI